MKLSALLAALVIGLVSTPAARADEARARGALFSEGFDDARLLERGWYDGDRFAISAQGARAGNGCIEYHWKAGGRTPDSSSGLRRLFEPTETVYLRCYVRLSKGWGWTGRAYHPHLMHFMAARCPPVNRPKASS